MTNFLCRAVCLLVVLSSVVSAEVLTTEMLQQKKDDWPRWAESKQTLRVTGRYRDHNSAGLHLQKLSLSFQAGRGVQIPRRLRLGTRLKLTGFMESSDGTLRFVVSRVTDEGADLQRLSERLAELKTSPFEPRYRLAAEFQRLADFFEDRRLAEDVSRVRRLIVQDEITSGLADPDALWRLIDPGPGFPLPQETRESVLFRIVLLREPQPGEHDLAAEIRQHLSGWDRPQRSVPQTLLTSFLKVPAETYERADAIGRRALERLLYRRVRLQQIMDELTESGGNGMRLAKNVQQELPEEDGAVRQLQSRWADSRRSKLTQLSRSDMEEVADLLIQLQRSEDSRKLLQDWLAHQQQRFEIRGLPGLLRVADEYQHAARRWQNPELSETAVEFLKKAWLRAREESPEDAEEIDQRLSQFGWTWLHGRWMTRDAVARLPLDDMELAQKQGRVVRRMPAAMVRSILGAPTRRIRMSTAQAVEEIWVFGDRFSSRLTVRLRRARNAGPDDGLVVEVTQVRIH